ncbi:MAG: hypothetical protein ACFB4I_16575 [Cyanophyceae cyanobacterium]
MSDRGSFQKAEVEASLVDERRSVTAKLACFNINAVRVASWRESNFTDPVQQLHAKTLRFPGGTVANYWDWKRGGVIQDTSRLPRGLPNFLRYKARRYKAGGLEELQAGLDLTDTAPIFVLNLLTSNIKSQIEMLRTASELGIPVQHIELGNEFYFNIPNYKKFFPRPEDYAATARRWIAAIRQEFPEAKISVVGVAPDPQKPERLQHWNRLLLNQVADRADAISLHIYGRHGLDSQVDPELEYPFFTAEEVSIILGEPFRVWQTTRERDAYQRIPNNMERWITEYNYIEKATVPGQEFEQRVVGSWTHGLYALEMALLFLEDPRVTTICNHDLIGNSMFTAVHLSELPETENAGSFKFSATGLTLQLFNEAIAGMTEAQQIDFSPGELLQGQDNFRYPALYGWRFSNEDEQRALIINLSEQRVTVNLENLMLEGAEYKQLYADPRTLVEDSRSVEQEQGAASQTLELAPYAITKLSIQLPESQ